MSDDPTVDEQTLRLAKEDLVKRLKALLLEFDLSTEHDGYVPATPEEIAAHRAADSTLTREEKAAWSRRMHMDTVYAVARICRQAAGGDKAAQSWLDNLNFIAKLAVLLTAVRHDMEWLECVLADEQRKVAALWSMLKNATPPKEAAEWWTSLLDNAGSSD